MSSAKHVPALDGLRGLAVLAVIAFHAGGALSGGYLGVDLFFVLSGYLITGILLREYASTGRIDLRAFWIRRARRLLPALLLLMPAIAIYAKVFAEPREMTNLRADALATLGYFANWRTIYAGKNYWQLFASPSPLEHTWSLAIEEQFYLVWPLVVVSLLVVLRASRHVVGLVSVVLAIASAGTMFFLTQQRIDFASRIYMGSDTRAAAILAGAALATWLPSERIIRKRRTLDVVGVLALVLLGVAWATLEGENPWLFRGGLWLTELAALVVIACAVTPGGVVARALSWRPLVFVGTLSYGLYLWHWPVDVVLSAERVPLSPLPLNILRLATTFAIAIASYRWVEEPIRSRGVFFAKPVVVVPLAFAGVTAAVVWATRASAASPSFAPDDLPLASDLPHGTLRVLVVGDSVAQYLGTSMRLQQTSARASVAQRGVGACSIHNSDDRYVNGTKIEGTSCATMWPTDVKTLRPDVTLITLGGGFLGPRTCDADWRASYNARLTTLLRSIKGEAGRIVLALVPYPARWWNKSKSVPLVDCFNDELSKVGMAEGVDTLDLKGHLCPTTECIQTSAGWPVRPDGLHFEGPGAVETAQWTLAELRRMAGPRL